MRLKIFFIAILFILSHNLKAQTTITGIVTDSLNNPIPFASVYLSKTTIGTLTDKEGIYLLNFSQEGIYDMIVSSIGFKSKSLLISAEGKNQKINIKLSINLILLKEISVKSVDKNKLKNYTQFRNLFLGKTANSQNCKILNPEDIHLFSDPQNGYLKGFSIRPLRIENKYLGYTIIYDLSDFSYNSTTGVLRFSGNQQFFNMVGNQRNKAKWARNRLISYYGSRLHFLRALFLDSLNQENFKIYECKIDSNSNQAIIVKPLLLENLRISSDKNDMIFFYNKPILISYTDNHPELSSGLLGFQPQEYKSTLIFSDTLVLNKSGYFENPYSLTWGGNLSYERIAELLPCDYQPHIVEKNEVDSLAILDPVEELLASKQNSENRDQIFVQLDRNMYNPDDTIFFQAYIKNRFSGVFESFSASLYAMLFNDKRMVIDSSRFRIANSTSSGWMTIPTDAKSGKYHFVAFTGMMQNYDPIDAFQTDLFIIAKDKEPEKIEIALNKTGYQSGDTIEASIKISDNKGDPIRQQKLECNLLTDNYTIDTNETLTDSRGESQSRFVIPDTVTEQPKLVVVTKSITKKSIISKNISIPFCNQFLDLRFLPEGGTFIAGVEQRIGFNATNIKGESLLIEGLLKRRNGLIIDTIKSSTYGPGLFVCVPERGMYIELIKGLGEKKTWPLPVPDSSGICLSVKPITNRSFAVEIQADNYRCDTVTVLGTMNVNKVFSHEITLNRKQIIMVKTDELPAGVVQITLFNNNLKPLAERLFYVNADKHIKFNIKTEHAVYNPGQETELSISAIDGSGNPINGIFSIAVVDSVSGHNPEIFTPGIEYALNYHPYFFGNLPSQVMVKGLENLSNEERDLLLMVYGWKKYNWDFSVLHKENHKELINYDILNMKILYAAKNRRADRRLDLVSLEGPSNIHLITNKNGEISLSLDSLPEITRSVTMLPDTKNKNRVTSAMLSIPYNQQYFKSNKLFIASPSISAYAYTITTNNITKYAKPSISLSEKTIELPEVAITGMKQNKREYHDQYEKMYQYANVRSLEPKQLWTSPSLRDAINRLISPYIFTDKYLILEYPHSFFGGSVPALFVLNGMPIYNDGWSTVKTISPGTITSLTILKGKQGYFRYGSAAQGGVVFINTMSEDPKLMKLKTEWKLQNNENKMLLPISIFRPNIEYYNPKKIDIEIDPVYQHRSTIFWKSEIYFDGKEPVKIKYPNLKRIGPVIITINGVSGNNLVGTGKASYSVYESNK